MTAFSESYKEGNLKYYISWNGDHNGIQRACHFIRIILSICNVH